MTPCSPAEGLTEAESLAKKTAWEEELSTLMSTLREAQTSGDAAQQTAASERYSAHYQRRKEFLNEQRTGFVWLYVQK